MNVLLMTDVEGITNVDDITMVKGEQYPYCCEQLMEDTNAAIRGFFDAGAENVYVFDGHSKGVNFIKELLDKRAIQVYSDNWNDYVTSGKIDAYAEVGLHAMAGTPNAFIEHTQNPNLWFDYKINGKSCGELIQGAAYVGAFNIPMVFVCGDDAACKEAKEFIPEIEAVVVKKGIDRNKAISLEANVARKKIYEGAKKSLSLIKTIKPYKITLPAEVTLTLLHVDDCDKLAMKYERVDGRTVKKVVEKIENYGSLLF